VNSRGFLHNLYDRETNAEKLMKKKSLRVFFSDARETS